jgi:hypothetical protein
MLTAVTYPRSTCHVDRFELDEGVLHHVQRQHKRFGFGGSRLTAFGHLCASGQHSFSPQTTRERAKQKEVGKEFFGLLLAQSLSVSAMKYVFVVLICWFLLFGISFWGRQPLVGRGSDARDECSPLNRMKQKEKKKSDFIRAVNL